MSSQPNPTNATQPTEELTIHEAHLRTKRHPELLRKRCRLYLAGSPQGLRCRRIGHGTRAILLVDAEALAQYQWQRAGRPRKDCPTRPQ